MSSEDYSIKVTSDDYKKSYDTLVGNVDKNVIQPEKGTFSIPNITIDSLKSGLAGTVPNMLKDVSSYISGKIKPTASDLILDIFKRPDGKMYDASVTDKTGATLTQWADKVVKGKAKLPGKIELPTGDTLDLSLVSNKSIKGALQFVRHEIGDVAKVIPKLSDVQDLKGTNKMMHGKFMTGVKSQIPNTAMSAAIGGMQNLMESASKGGVNSIMGGVKKFGEGATPGAILGTGVKLASKIPYAGPVIEGASGIAGTALTAKALYDILVKLRDRGGSMMPKDSKGD